MATPLPDGLVSTAWLADRLGAPEMRVVDASWYLAAAGRDARAEHHAGHIPGAVFFDLEASSDPHSALPHMLPSAAQFSEQIGGLGIGDEHTIVVYDGSGINLSAPRVWWMFRVFGHQRTALLDGGLGKWRREGRPLETGEPIHAQRQFTARFDAGRVRQLADMQRNLTDAREQVIDARADGRFHGTEPEPRPGLRAGHIPGSVNLPFKTLVTPEGTLLSPHELRARLLAAGVDLERPIVTTCGSGVTACAVLHALHLLGREGALYDGSWSEWGGRHDLAIE